MVIGPMTSSGPRCPHRRVTPSTWSPCGPELRPAVRRVLARVALVEDLAAAQALVAALPDVVAVTRDGDVLSAHFASGGSSAQPSLIEVQAAIDDAESRLADANHTLRAPPIRAE